MPAVRRIIHALAIAAFAVAAPAAAQRKPTLEPEDYKRWESLGSAELSPDGTWMAYTISRVDADGDLRIRKLGSDSTIVVDYGRGARFSPDNHWLAYSIGHSEKETEAARKAKKTLHAKLAILDLRAGTITMVDDIASFTFSGDGRFLALRGYAPEGSSGRGQNLIIRELATGRQTTFGNIAETAWRDRDDGSLLAMIVDTKDKVGNGVQLYDAATGTLRTLETDTAGFRELTWREDADDLAYFRIVRDSAFEGESNAIVAWPHASTRTAKRHDYGADELAAILPGQRIVEFRPLRWSDDGRSLYVGVQQWESKPAPAGSTEGGDSTKAAADPTDEKPGVEVWHARDVEIIPEQKVRANQERNRNYLAVWHIEDDRLVQIANELTEDASVIEGAGIAIATDETPHDIERMFGPVYRDIYVVDTETGDRRLIKSSVQNSYGGSPGGRYYLYLENDDYWVYDIERDTHTNITKDIATSFVDVDDDHTVEQKPPFGNAGWTNDDRTLLLYDEYDIWEVTPDGSKATKLTDGAAEQIRHRIYWIDRDEDYFDRTKPLYVVMTGERTKKSGYARLHPNGRIEPLVYLDKNVSRLQKAEDADVYAYVVQAFDDSPDYFVGGPGLADAQQVSETNSFQADYAWGHAELIEYQNTRGVPLQGALFYPANYEPGRQYPMIVYIYELTSQTLHSYSSPSERSAYNPTVWTQNGYFVLRPDIVYRDRNPGLSAVEALVPAVQKVLETGMVDAAHVGLVGHSWGGYETAFVPTQTDIFAAAVAGAPLTEMSSMYLSIYWNTGGTDARIFEISQGRMEVPPWQDLDAYVANSPVFQIEKLNTPMLVTFGDKDGAVDWHQGIVMYNAARRAGKDLVMLVYEGENHSLSREPNQLDYHRRIMQWFGHYLKGEPAPDWIENGVRFLDQGKAAVSTEGGG